MHDGREGHREHEHVDLGIPCLAPGPHARARTVVIVTPRWEIIVQAVPLVRRLALVAGASRPTTTCTTDPGSVATARHDSQHVIWDAQWRAWRLVHLALSDGTGRQQLRHENCFCNWLTSLGVLRGSGRSSQVSGRDEHGASSLLGGRAWGSS